MTHDQRKSKLEVYRKTGMDGKRTHLNVYDEEEQNDSTNQQALPTKRLPFSAAKSGITTIPLPILDSMFERANRLLESPENVISKPGATDGFFIVAGYSNKIHIVTPGKGGSIKCDRSCINSSTKICEHVLAVAQVRGTINEFLAYYKRSKRGPNLLQMSLGSAPKSAGRKPSHRKKSNKQKPAITEVRNLLDDTPTSIASSAQNTQPQISAPPIDNPNQTHSTSQFDNSNQTTSLNLSHNANHSPILNLNFNPYRNVNHNPNFNLHPDVNLNTNVNSNISQEVNLNTAHQKQSKSTFKLKWVAGTRVSRCYGCKGDIINPPQSSPDDLCVVYRDIREFRDRSTGQLQYTNSPENVHFHLKASCVRIRYPDFLDKDLVVSAEFTPHFKLEHVRRLVEEFNWAM